MMGKGMTGHFQHTSHFLPHDEETQPPESAVLGALSVAEPNNPLSGMDLQFSFF